MQDTAKYLVHADIAADGVVERSDVVGAVFGQTEGLLGDELDLRELQDASKVGRIDVEIDSANGQSFGRITIATSLDQVETAILGAALETIDRVGPCRSTIEVRKIEDVRAAKRREVVERAKRLLGSAFDESMRSSRDLVEEVRESVRIEDITSYEDLPAGPRVEESDAIVIVEGRADVLTLLQYGIKNAVAVEGTDVPDAVAKLTESKTVTAFLDGDRGGELIRKELAQVGDIDYVALAPEGRSVEDLTRHEVMTALRQKRPYDQFLETEPSSKTDGRESTSDPTEIETATPRETTPDAGAGTGADAGPDIESDEKAGEGSDPGASPVDIESMPESGAEPVHDKNADDRARSNPSASDTDPGTHSKTNAVSESSSEDGFDDSGDGPVQQTERNADDSADAGSEQSDDAETLRDHTRSVIGEQTGRVRFLDGNFRVVAETDASEAFDRLADADEVPAAVVIDGELAQRVLDVAAQRGVDHVVAASTGEFVKRPTSVRIRTVDQLLAPNEA